MSFGDFIDYMLAMGQSLVAVLLWHQAEPRVREARGRWRAACTMLLGFVLAFSVVLSLSRPSFDDPLDWQRSVRDALLLAYAVCIYCRAMMLPKGDQRLETA